MTSTYSACFLMAVNKQSKIKLYAADNRSVLKEFINRDVKFNIVYADPPYNTGQTTLTYNDRFDQNIWEKMMEETFTLTKKVMSKDAVLFVSIGNEEFAELKLILDKVFGKKNFVAMLPRISNTSSKTTKMVSKQNDWLLIYKNGNPHFNGLRYEMTQYKLKDKHFDERGFYQIRNLAYKDFHYSKKMDHPVTFNDKTFYPGSSIEKWKERKFKQRIHDWCWLWNRERIEFAIKNDFIIERNGALYKKTYQNIQIKKIENKYEIVSIKRTKPISSLHFIDKYFRNNDIAKITKDEFSYTKSDRFLKEIYNLPLFEKKNILDLYAGSGVSGIVSKDIKKLEEMTLIQLNEKHHNKNVAEITKSNLKKYGIEILNIKKLRGVTNDK